jgi:hypothetical protein
MKQDSVEIHIKEGVIATLEALVKLGKLTEDEVERFHNEHVLLLRTKAELIKKIELK